MNPRPGEVWLADLGLAVKTRPVVIVSRRDEDPPRALAVYVPLTTQDRRSNYEVEIPHLPFLRQQGVANVQGIASIPTSRLGTEARAVAERNGSKDTRSFGIPAGVRTVTASNGTAQDRQGNRV